MSRRTSLTLIVLLGAAAPAAAACVPYRGEPIAVTRDAAYRTAGGSLRIVGYNDMAEMIRPIAARFGVHHPGVRFELVLEGTRTAPPALTDGSSLVAPMGAEWEIAPLTAYRAKHGSDPVMIRVAHASLNPRARSSPTAVIVHRDNPLRSLSMAQVRAIFTGPPMDWTDLAQPQRGKIRTVGFSETTAIGGFLHRTHFADQRFAAGYDGKPQSREVVDAVAADPQAIGLANLNHADGRVRVVGLSNGTAQRPSFGSAADIRAGRYPLDRHLLVYARRDAGGRVEPPAREWLKLMLSCEGQAIIARGSLRYLPLSDRDATRERAKLN